jgi:hypothetical protein
LEKKFMPVTDFTYKIVYECLFCALLVGCSNDVPPPLLAPSTSPAAAPQKLLFQSYVSGGQQDSTAEPRAWRFSILIDDGRTIKDPLEFAGASSVDREASGVEGFYGEEIYEVPPEGSTGVKAGNAVSLQHFLFPCGDAYGCTADQRTMMMAYVEHVQEKDRRLLDVANLDHAGGLTIPQDAQNRFAVSWVNQALKSDFNSSRIGLPVPLKKDDVVAFWDASMQGTADGDGRPFKPMILPIVVRVTGETELFRGKLAGPEQRDAAVNCYIARGSFDRSHNEITAYISITAGIVVKTIIQNRVQKWRVIKTMYPTADLR